MTRETIESVRHLHSETMLADEAVKILHERNARDAADLLPRQEVAKTEEKESADRLLQIPSCQNLKNQKGTEKLEEDVLTLRPDLAPTRAPRRDLETESDFL